MWALESGLTGLCGFPRKPRSGGTGGPKRLNPHHSQTLLPSSCRKAYAWPPRVSSLQRSRKRGRGSCGILDRKLTGVWGRERSLLQSFPTKFTLRPLETREWHSATTPPPVQVLCPGIPQKVTKVIRKSCPKQRNSPSPEQFPKTRAQDTLRSAMGCLSGTFVRKSFPSFVPA